MEIIFTAFVVKVRKDDLGMRPLKFRHKCYKLALRGGTRLAINVQPPHKRTTTVRSAVSLKIKRNLVGED